MRSTTIDLNLKRKETRFNNTVSELLSLFHASATGKSNKSFRFAKVDSHFADFLPYLKDGAIKLYLYYAVVANNDTGESWYSIDTISKKLGATERSIGNWNNQLEELGLIFRTSTGKKSKATFVLPLTGFALKMNMPQIGQVFDELSLSSVNQYTKVFGKVQSVTKLYVKGETANTINEVLCIHLQKLTTVDSVEINRVNTFIYNISTTTNEDAVKKLWAVESEEKVAIVNGEKEITLGKRTPTPLECFFINDPCKIDDATVYEIMSQLVDDVDISDLEQITI